MAIFQNRNSQVFVDYIPAELHENKVWQIVYYVKNPYTDKLERKRNRVKPLKSITQRRQLAKRMIHAINGRLESGWNPFLQNKGTKELHLLKDALSIYLKQKDVEFADNNLSYDTHKTYTSQVKNLNAYLSMKKIDDMMCYKFDENVISDFLDYLRYTKNLAARTRDNYMTFIKTLCAWMVSKKYLAANPSTGFKKINKKTKTRVVIPADDRNKIFNYYKEHNLNFLTFCMTCYYCLVRRTELTKIKVSDVDLVNNTLHISAQDSKNKKSAFVTLPPELAELLKKHVVNAKPTHYLFSNLNYAPGVKRFHPDKATKEWAKMRKTLSLRAEIQWYSLKDTGITDLILAGVPLLSVRDQARHQDIKQTDEYTPRGMKHADAFVKNSGVEFRKS